jgi:hypothetical protein
MKLIAIALSIIFIVFIIGSNAFTSSNLLRLKEQEESYLACKSLKRKAPNLKLNCEKLIPKKVEEAKEIQNINSEIKILRTSDTGTRKINKIEEIKLRNLIWKLAYENTIRTD